MPDLAHRLLALGVRRDRELRAYGIAAEHEDAHGLSPASIAARAREFLCGTR